jgi:hypothetical protein
MENNVFKEKLKACSDELAKALGDIAAALPTDEARKEFRESCYLAGGCIWSIFNGEEPNDYDVFCKDHKTAMDIEDALRLCHEEEYSSENALSFRLSVRGKPSLVQIISSFYGQPQDVIGQFDFLHNMYAFDGDAKFYTSLCYGQPDYTPLTNKLLMLNKANKGDLASVACRAVKFIRRGFAFGETDMAELLSLMVAQYGSDPQKLIERLGSIGEDTKYDDDALVMQGFDFIKEDDAANKPSPDHLPF